jgi:hypothetical protein
MQFPDQSVLRPNRVGEATVARRPQGDRTQSRAPGGQLRCAKFARAVAIFAAGEGCEDRSGVRGGDCQRYADRGKESPRGGKGSY